MLTDVRLAKKNMFTSSLWRGAHSVVSISVRPPSLVVLVRLVAFRPSRRSLLRPSLVETSDKQIS